VLPAAEQTNHGAQYTSRAFADACHRARNPPIHERHRELCGQRSLDQLLRPWSVSRLNVALKDSASAAKQECGLDDYQVRRYPGGHRHITLTMAAHLTVLRARKLNSEKAETDPPSSPTTASPRSDA
jgi:hypothetical protein